MTRPIGIYIAGSSAEVDRCERAIAYAASIGLLSTLDWTGSIRNAIAAGVREHELPREERERLADLDLDAVCRASAIVLLAPGKGSPSRGCWVELGYALRLGRPVYVIRVPEAAPESLFEVRATQVYATDDRHGLRQIRTLLLDADVKRGASMLLTAAQQRWCEEHNLGVGFDDDAPHLTQYSHVCETTDRQPCVDDPTEMYDITKALCRSERLWFGQGEGYVFTDGWSEITCERCIELLLEKGCPGG